MTSKSTHDEQITQEEYHLLAPFAKYITHWLALGGHPTHGLYSERFDEQSDRGKKAGLSFAGGLRFIFGGKKGDAKARMMESNLFQRQSFSAYVSHTSLLLWYPKMVLIYKKTCCA